MDVQQISDRLGTYAQELLAINERLCAIHRVVFGGGNTSERPLSPPEPPTSGPGATGPAFNLQTAFTNANEHITYSLDYAREMISSLETFTGASKPSPMKGVPANQTGSTFPGKDYLR